MTVHKWQERAGSFARAKRIGRQLVEQSQGNLYQIGYAFYESAFAHYLTEPNGQLWRDDLQEALALYALARDRNDCERWPEFPFNLAHLLVETYLGKWLLEQEMDEELLAQAVNRYVDALFNGHAQPLASFAVLPPVYLLKGDDSLLATFWRLIGEKAEPSEFSPDLKLWWRWSDNLLNGQTTAEAFWSPYVTFKRRLKSPTDQPARFYLAAARIGRLRFALDDEPQVLLQRLAMNGGVVA